MSDFQSAIRAAGLTPPDHIKPGKFQRFPGLDKSRANKAGWCKLFPDGKGGIFGDYSTGLSESWQARRERPYTEIEKAEFNRKVAAERERQEAKEAAEKDRQKEKALKDWEAASAASDHPYLTAKGVKSRGLRTDGRNLLIPLRDITGTFQGLQWIGPEGHKGFAKGSTLQGSYFPIGKPNGRLLICEGYATGASIHEVTGHAVAVAFNAGNLKAVAEALRGKYPDMPIIIAADNDQWTEGNPGMRKAREAAKAVGGQMVIPQFKDISTKPTDFNDLRQLEGADKVKEQINNVTFMHGGYEWPEPMALPDGKPSVKAFDFELLPDAFRPWIEDIAERISCPPDFPAVAAMVALSSVVGRKAGIRPKRYDDWLVVPNLWGAVIGRPGIMKTPALGEALKPLDRLVMEAKSEHAELSGKTRANKDVMAAKRSALKSRLKEAFKEGNERAAETLTRQLEAIDSEEAEPPRERRFKTNDCTVESLGEILNANPDGILVFRDELTGWLRSLDKDGRETDRAFYLEAWNGSGSYDYDRIGRGNVYIEAACVSILGGIQPGPLSQYVRSAEHGGQGADGLLQRFQLMVYPDDAGEWRDIDRWPNTNAKNKAYEVFKRLAHLDPLSCGALADEESSIPFFRFSPEAQQTFIEWRTQLERGKLRNGEPEIIEAHLSKYRSLIPSLALLCHLADGGAGPVDEMAMIRAASWSDYLESHARRVFADALAPDVAPAIALAKRILAGDLSTGFTPKDIYRRHWQHLDKPSTEKAIEYLEDLDWLLVETRKTGGRPSMICRINPKLRANA